MRKSKGKKRTNLKMFLHRAAKMAAIYLSTERCCCYLNVVGSIVICYFLITMAFIKGSSQDNRIIPQATNSFQSSLPEKEMIETTELTIEEVEEKIQTVAELLPKTILLWTPYYNRSDFTIGFGRDPFTKAGCKVSNCILTDDRKRLTQSDAVVFHALQVNDRDLPKQRNPRQRFVFFLYETIPNTTIPCVGKCLPEKQYTPHYFNWTMTHRRDSDIYVAEPYGAIEPKYWTLPPQLPDDLPSGTLPADPVVLFNRRYPDLANRTKMVAWFVSHCPTHSQREDYVKELAKHVQVDIYGRCGSMECLPRNSARCNSVLENYKFYLAAENSLCPDYVSEKFYRALSSGIVPIVYGGADYADYAPPHSYVNVADFKSPKELAAYLSLLDKNDALYIKYFHWKKHYQVVKSPMKGWCDLCAKLNDPQQEKETKSYADVADWWVRKYPCYPGSSFLMNHTEP